MGRGVELLGQFRNLLRYQLYLRFLCMTSDRLNQAVMISK